MYEWQGVMNRIH
ncbi:hypothetical protein VCHENC02_0921A, partial [Vibrio harveyi]